MDTTVAAVVLAWIAIALLALGFAGLRVQVRELQAGFLSRGATTLAPARDLSIVMRGGRAAFVLLTTDDCAVCATIAPRFDELAKVVSSDVESIVLKRREADTSETVARLVVNPGAFNSVDPGYVPALLLLDQHGTVMATEPVGSIEALNAVVARYELKSPARHEVGNAPAG